MKSQKKESYVVYRESEHQELHYPDADMTVPLQVHIPSALGVLGYYVCVRGPEAWAEKLSDVRIKAQIGGLRPDDIEVAYGENLKEKQRIPSTEDGLVWHLLCRAYMSRGDGTITFIRWPEDIPRADVLLCTWPRYVTSGQADQWLACQSDPSWAPTGIPLGGIGCGRVDLCRDGRFRNFSGNNNQDMPLEDPAGLADAVLSVTVDGKAVSLTTSAVEEMTPCPDLEFDGRFPQATLKATVEDNVHVRVLASGMLCPHDPRRSGLPGVLLRWTVRNESAGTREIVCGFQWPNLVGIGGGIGQEETDIGKGDGVYCYWEETDEQKEIALEHPEFVGVTLGNPTSLLRQASAGEHVLMSRQAEGARSEVDIERHTGRLVRALTLMPGQERTVDMALVWAMPHWVDTKGVDRGHLWQKDFSGGVDIGAEILDNADEILAATGALAELLDAGSLPDWLRRRLSNCCYPLVTNSVLYRDGRFSINEGPTEMVGCYGTIDQRLGAHPATQILFPDLNDRELSEFADYQGEDGGINHDLGHGHLELGPRPQSWPDIPCSFIIQCARHAWSSGDGAFEKRIYPHARRALERDAEWHEQGNGVAQTGKRFGTSYDGYHYEGTTPYLGTLWLAALAVMERWAPRMGDEALLPRIESWRAAALERMEEDIWNGEFYWTYGSPNGPVRETSFAGQVAGQVYTRMLTGADVLRPERLDGCVDAVMRLNGSDRFAVPPDEVHPSGESAVMYGWLPYVEAFGLTAAATEADARMMDVWERVVRHMNQNGERLCDTRLMYRPAAGQISWGSYYMTAPASWLVYDAVLDFFYEPGEALLRLNPMIQGTLPVAHPLWWGLAEVDTETVRLRFRKVYTDRLMQIASIALPVETAQGRTYEPRILEAPVQIAKGNEVSWKRS